MALYGKYISEEKAWGQTTWVNPSDKHTVKFELLTNIQSGKMGTGRQFRKVEIPPNGKVTLSSEYDKAIRQENQLGQIIGGVCPWLLKEGENDVNLHPAMKAHELLEKQELYKLAEQIKESRDLAEAKDVMQTLKKGPGRPKKVVEE